MTSYYQLWDECKEYFKLPRIFVITIKQKKVTE